MMVSAYGSCLSQDRIAYFEWGGVDSLEYDLAHGEAVYCNEYDAGGSCTAMLAWAFGIRNPPGFPYQPDPPTSFNQVEQYLDQHRPIMSLGDGEDHIRVIAGYCKDDGLGYTEEGRDWVFVYDPKSGPRLELFESWRDSSTGTWIGPDHVVIPPLMVKGDEITIWTNCDGDEYCDFDEVHRRDTPPCP